MWTCPIYVINLASRPDRKAAAEAQLARAGLKATFVEAVDGRALTPEDIASVYDDSGRQKRAGKPMTPGELGCYLSHWMIFCRMLAERTPKALILEDDFIATPHLRPVLDALADRRGLPDYDIVKLGVSELARRRRHIRLARLTGEACLVRHYNVCNSTVAYVITQAAVRRFIRQGLPIRYPIDVALNRSWWNGLNILGVRPWPVHHDMEADSSIGHDRFEDAGRRGHPIERRLRKTYDSVAKRAYVMAMRARDRSAHYPHPDQPTP
jgi:glycosyl transferase family 25